MEKFLSLNRASQHYVTKGGFLGSVLLTALVKDRRSLGGSRFYSKTTR